MRAFSCEEMINDSEMDLPLEHLSVNSLLSLRNIFIERYSAPLEKLSTPLQCSALKPDYHFQPNGLIDEAGCAKNPEILLPLTTFKSLVRCVLASDYLQLGPTVCLSNFDGLIRV